MTNNTKTETVTLSLSVRLYYETEAGREHLLKRLEDAVEIDMEGAGYIGRYSMKSIAGTAKVNHHD